MDLRYTSEDVARAAQTFASRWGHGDIWRMLNAYADLLREAEQGLSEPEQGAVLS